MPHIVLKVDVDTWRGTRLGVPALMKLFLKHQVPATFLLSLGPDNTGRAIARVFRPGFFSKVSRTSVVKHYGIKTLLYGTLLPSPDIGLREKNILRELKTHGFDLGIHCWDHITWQDNVFKKNALWTQKELWKAYQRFIDIFGEAPQTHGAAGWQMNPFGLQWIDDMGMAYASDGRGQTPYRPSVDGKVLNHIQMPGNLPTLDELIGLNGVTEDNVHEHLLQITANPGNSQYPDGSFIYTLHAELEGMRLLHVMDRLIQGWKAQGFEFFDMRQMYYALDKALPVCEFSYGSIPGRSGELYIQTA